MATAPYLKQLDSFEFEARFSTDNQIKYDEIRNSNISFEEIRPFLDRLPSREVDLIELYYRFRKNQKDIARMFGVTQGAISSRLARARKRLEFLRDIPKITDTEIEVKLGNYFEPIEVEIIKCMMETTCQSRTAEIINERFELVDEKEKMTQVKVRHRFEKCIAQLNELQKFDADLVKFVELLDFIKKNLYKLHEVKLPHFDRGAFAVFSMNTGC